MVEFYILTFPRFPLRKKEHKSYFGKNRTHDFRTSRCAAYLLDHYTVHTYLLIHTFSVLSLQLRKLRQYNSEGLGAFWFFFKQASHDLSNANPGSGHKEVPRSTGHIVVTTRYSDQQGSKSLQKVMRLYKQWHRPISKRSIKPPYSISGAASIDSDCCRLPTTSVLSNKADKLRSNQFWSTSPSFSRPHIVQKEKKIEIPRSKVLEALSWWSRRASQHPAVQSPVHPGKSPTNLARSPLLVALVGMTVVRRQLLPQKPPGSRLWLSRTGVHPSPGSSTIELPSAFAESGAYPPDRALPSSPRQCSLPLACRHTSRRAPNWSSEGAHTW